MAKAKKKNRAVAMFAAVAVLAALIAVYFLIPRDGTDTETDAGIADSPHWENLSGLTELEISNGDTLRLESSDSTWILTDEPDRPLDQSIMDTMIGNLTMLTPIRLIDEDPQDLSVYGLGKDAVSIGTGSGQIVLGDQNSVTGDRYVLWTDGKVYTVLSAGLDTFALHRAELTQMETLPSISVQDVSSLKVEGGEEVLLMLEHLDIPKADDPTQSYLWYMLDNGQSRAADSSKAETLVNSFINPNLGACAEYKTDAQVLSEYGFDQPEYTVSAVYTPTVTDANGMSVRGNEKTFTLTVGRIDDDGTAYVRFNNCQGIYTANGSELIHAADTPAASLRAADWVTMTEDSLTGVNFSLRGTFMEIGLTRETVTDEDGNESEVKKVTLNGSEIDASAFSKLYADLRTLTTEDRVSDAKAESEDSVLTMRLSAGGEPLVIKLLPYDPSFYVADMNGNRELLLNRRDVDAFCDEVMEFYLNCVNVQNEETTPAEE